MTSSASGRATVSARLVSKRLRCCGRSRVGTIRERRGGEIMFVVAGFSLALACDIRAPFKTSQAKACDYRWRGRLSLFTLSRVNPTSIDTLAAFRGNLPFQIRPGRFPHPTEGPRMRLLVTGGLGYLGSILCEHLLDAGHHVLAADNLMYGQGQQGLFHLCANPRFQFAKGDVRDEAFVKPLLRDRDAIVHL